MIVIKNLRWASISVTKDLNKQEEMQMRALIETYLMRKHGILADVEVKDDNN
jgi:hypothetical protein